jgi:hypothetical protein
MPEGLSLRRARRAAAFEWRAVAVPPGERPVHGDEEWRDALVVVEHGEIELVCAGDARPRFRQGDVLWLTGLGLRAIRNPGPGPASLAVVRRRQRRTP